jgi:hypothetical protein
MPSAIRAIYAPIAKIMQNFGAFIKYCCFEDVGFF